jgi:hypothetical protein
VITFCSIKRGRDEDQEILMKRWIFPAVFTALIAATWWHLPASAQRAAPPAASETITFEQYRDFRLHDLAQRQARLAKQLTGPDLSAAERANLERRKAYYDQLAATPAEERDRLYRERFNQIDANHDGRLDPEERAAWRAKQREYYRQQAAERSGAVAQQH